MDGGERMDFLRKKKRTDSSRKPRSGGSHGFMNEHDHSSPSGSPSTDPRNNGAAGFDKGSNDDAGKYSKHHVHEDDYRRKLGSSNSKGRYEMVKEDLGRSKSVHRRAGGGGDDDWGPEKDEMKRVRRDAAEFGGTKHRSPEEYDRKHDRGGSKTQDYDGNNRRFEKFPKEKSHRDGGHYDKDSKDYGEKGGERDRRLFGETFKRKMRGDDLDRPKRFRDSGMERKDSHDRHVSHEKSDRDRDRDREWDRDRDRNHDGASHGRSHEGQGNTKSVDGSHKPVVVGLGSAVGSVEWRNSDGHKVLERRSSDAHTMSQAKGGADSTNGAVLNRLQDGSRNLEGRTMDGHQMGQLKSANVDVKAAEGLNVAHVKTGTDGKSSDIKEALDKSMSRQDDLHSQENRLTKVKLKVSGIIRTIHANLTSGSKQRAAEGLSTSARLAQAPEGGRRRQRLILQENSDDEDDFPPRMEKCLPESLRKDTAVNTSSTTARMDISLSKEDRRNRFTDEGTSGKRAEMNNNYAGSQPVRKSLRIPKKRVLDGEIDDDEDAEEAAQRKTSRPSKKRMLGGEYDEEREGDETPQRKSSRIPKKRMLESEHDEDEEHEAQQHKKKRKKPRSGRESEGLYEDYNEDEAVSEEDDFENPGIEPDGRKFDEKKEAPLTARQRAMQSCKDVDTAVGANLIEFPEGLPQSCPRRKKEKLSEVDQQLKKAEAAQRRKQQVEKAANAQQAEAIKKILGQDSSRKKKEDKLRKQRDEKEQERSASGMVLASNSVRWVMGPTGTVVQFSEDAGLPSIFNSAPRRYPPAREKCAGPLCNNTYKYRDSKSNLPLCSLQCYRAIHDATHAVSTC